MTLCTISTRQRYQALLRRGLLHGTIKSCLALRDQRDAAGQAVAVCQGRIAGLAAARRARRSVPAVVPLGSAGDAVLARYQRANSRLR